MANEYIQRQISGFLGVGTATMANQYDQSKNLWQVQDVYPSKIMQLDPGKYTSGSLTVSASGGTATIPLPGEYDPAQRLAVFIASDQTIKSVTVSPVHSTSTVMVTAGAAQSGLLIFCERVTSITLTNAGTIIANVTYSTWEYPPDLMSESAWEAGNETVGFVHE